MSYIDLGANNGGLVRYIEPGDVFTIPDTGPQRQYNALLLGGLFDEDFRSAVRELEAECEDEPFIFAVVMPCNRVFVCRSVEDIPDENVPCPCRDPTHWFVNHSRIREE